LKLVLGFDSYNMNHLGYYSYDHARLHDYHGCGVRYHGYGIHFRCHENAECNHELGIQQHRYSVRKEGQAPMLC